MRKLIVRNFGPVNDVEIELRGINLFIGSQSIGKSTLAKLITILTDHLSLCRLVFGGNDMWDSQLKEYGLDAYRDDKYKIIYDMNEDGWNLHIEIHSGNVTSYLYENDKRITNKRSIINTIMNSKTIYHEDSVLKTLRDSPGSIVNIMTNSLYVPAERIICSVIDNLLPAIALAKSTVPVNLLRFMVDLNNAKSLYSQYDVPLLDILYKQESSKDYIVVKANEKTIPLTLASSGVQSLIPLLLILKYAIEQREYSSIVIEEPECNLFPEKQVELLKAIITMVKEPSRILTITTHSPYLLSAMNNWLLAGKMVEEYSEKAQSFLDKSIPGAFYIEPSDCAVYSLGAEINGDGIYCKSLLDEETGMIDFNSLDGISESLSNEFMSLQDGYINLMNNTRS